MQSASLSYVLISPDKSMLKYQRSRQQHNLQQLHPRPLESLTSRSLDFNSAEDTGHLRVTYSNNSFSNVSSRGPFLRFGTGHIYNSYYENVSMESIPVMGRRYLSREMCLVGVRNRCIVRMRDMRLRMGTILGRRVRGAGRGR